MKKQKLAVRLSAKTDQVVGEIVPVGSAFQVRDVVSNKTIDRVYFHKDNMLCGTVRDRHNHKREVIYVHKFRAWVYGDVSKESLFNLLSSKGFLNDEPKKRAPKISAFEWLEAA